MRDDFPFGTEKYQVQLFFFRHPRFIFTVSDLMFHTLNIDVRRYCEQLVVGGILEYATVPVKEGHGHGYRFEDGNNKPELSFILSRDYF
ncbi:MAG: hypothetical protein ACFFD4_22020 [Candidatus Odinarchaeota archaeon]